MATNQYDVIVVGAGHAGCEAATAAARLGSRVLLVTMDLEKVAQMSCNPAVGGIAKGQIVREIDALDGWMGRITDESTIQFRMLNRSKGAAMWSPRSQCDRMLYSSRWREVLDYTDNLFLWQDTVSSLLIKRGQIAGVRTTLGQEFGARAVILTNGTFLNGLMHVGRHQFVGGRLAEPCSHGLTEQLIEMGFEQGRMKTGTPMRVDGRTIDFSLCQEQKGDEDFHRFSYLHGASNKRLPQHACYITYTNPDTHKVLRANLDDSPLYNGQIQSIGPRYCPSIETKITTFADKSEHHLFLEPEGAHTNQYYVNGFSSSLPFEVQERAMRTIPALRETHILRPGYAIEYDYFIPTQLHHTLETKRVQGLFFAGQINGTTGYEEAAGQGLVAGVNAHIKTTDPSKEFVLRRDEAYIGVLIDDLVTKGVDEPYRMFTSRAEYRILLRQDNADRRLTPKGEQLGLISAERLQSYRRKQQQIERLKTLCEETSVTPTEVNGLLEHLGSSPIRQKSSVADLLLRPTLSLSKLRGLLPTADELPANGSAELQEVEEAVEIWLKYKGYIDRERGLAEKAQRLEAIRLQGHVDYAQVSALSTEAREKLLAIDPETIGQASRIPGVSPSDINILLVLLGR